LRLSWNEIRARAAEFARDWSDARYEKGETQSFYNDFFQVFGIQRRKVADRTAAAIVPRRIRRVAMGNLGDARSVGDGVSELRIHHGPGYRVYFTRRGNTVIVLLCGGDKGSQARDITQAKALAKEA
jgi:putative addiction module killer protein